jgi:rubrerythrin
MGSSSKNAGQGESFTDREKDAFTRASGLTGTTHIWNFNWGKKADKRIPNLDAIRNKIRLDTLREIESETRRLSKVKAEIPNPKKRFAGKQDWTDLPQNVPIQKLALDQLGIVVRPNAPYRCPKCGAQYMGLPPPVCQVCRNPSYFSKLNLRR